MPAAQTKEVIVIGGPNGAGKTTAATDLVPKTLGIHEFVNADEIARGLSPFNPEGSAFAAGRLMIERVNTLADQGESFALETTCSGIGHTRLLAKCRALGYRLTLLFLWLPSAEIAVTRVAKRVSEGGHQIPRDVIRRRYVAGIRNMRHVYLPLVDIGLVYDNSDRNRAVIAERRPDAPLLVHDPIRWKQIEKQSE